MLVGGPFLGERLIVATGDHMGCPQLQYSSAEHGMCERSASASDRASAGRLQVEPHTWHSCGERKPSMARMQSSSLTCSKYIGSSRDRL